MDGYAFPFLAHKNQQTEKKKHAKIPSHTLYVKCALCSKTSKFRPILRTISFVPIVVTQNYKSVNSDKKSHPHLQNENLCSGNGFSLKNSTPKNFTPS